MLRYAMRFIDKRPSRCFADFQYLGAMKEEWSARGASAELESARERN